MKTIAKQPLQFLWFFLSLIIWGATALPSASQVLRYDFQKKAFINPKDLEKVKKGKFYQVQIENINPYLYKISINSKDSTISKPVSVPSLSLLGLGDLAGMVASITPLGNIAGTSPSVQVPKIKSSAQKIVEKGFRFGGAMDDTLASNNLPIIVVDKAKLLIDAYQDVTKTHYKRLNQLKNRVDSIMEMYNRLSVVAHVEHLPNNPTGIYDVSELTLENLHFSLDTVRKALFELELDVLVKNENYLRDIKPYAEVVEKKPELKAANEKVMEVHTEFASVLTKTKETLSADNLLKYMTSIAAVLNNSGRTYISSQMQAVEEQTTLRLSIIPRKEDSFLQSHHAKLVFPLSMKEFWGVSSGFFMSSLYHEAYSTQQINTPEDTTYVIVSEEPTKAEFGVNAMFRYGWQLNEKLFWQVGFGPGAAISDKIRPRLMAGTGAAWGDKHKFILDFGGILGFTDVLTKVYSSNERYAMRPTNTTVSRMKIGTYFSIGYLFF